MRNRQEYIPKAGDVIAWNNSSKCTSIAIMMNEDEFSVCLNFRGRKDEEDRLWEWDNIPTDKTVRRADKLEMAWLFAELVVQGYEFEAKDGKVVIPIEYLCPSNHEEEPEITEPEVKVECVVLNRQQRFAKYVYELVELYEKQGNYRNMSDVAKHNSTTPLKKEVCYLVGLHQLKDKKWLKSIEGKSFCQNLYEYALHHTTKYPLIPQSQR